jgi:hypothetical protein
MDIVKFVDFKNYLIQAVIIVLVLLYTVHFEIDRKSVWLILFVTFCTFVFINNLSQFEGKISTCDNGCSKRKISSPCEDSYMKQLDEIVDQ